MSLYHTESSIDFLSERSFFNHTFIAPKSHIASFICQSLLMFHDMDDVVFAIGSKFLA